MELVFRLFFMNKARKRLEVASEELQVGNAKRPTPPEVEYVVDSSQGSVRQQS